MALKFILLTVGTAPNDVNFVVKGNPQTYTDIAGLDGVTTFDAVEIETPEAWAKTLNVVTPVVSLLESGSFKHLELREKGGKKKRTAVVPTSAVLAITSAVESTAGASIGGITCGSVSPGLSQKRR